MAINPVAFADNRSRAVKALLQAAKERLELREQQSAALPLQAMLYQAQARTVAILLEEVGKIEDLADREFFSKYQETPT